MNTLTYLPGYIIIFLGLICYGFFIGIKLKNTKSINWLKEGVKILLTIYILMVASVTLFPMPLSFNVSAGWEHLKFSVNLVPLVTIIKDMNLVGVAYDGDAMFMIGLIIRNVGGNILLLMPLGFLAPVLWFRYRQLKNTVMLGLITSISIETIQFIELITGGSRRIVDIDDVICNVIGAATGYLIYKMAFGLGGKFQIKLIQKIGS